MNNIERILTGINIESIKQKLNAHPEWWDEITVRQDHPGSYHKDTRTIYLIGPKAFSYSGVYQDLSSKIYPHWDDFEDEIEDIGYTMFKACGLKQGGRVMLVELKPEGRIPRHTDEGPYAEHYSRFHIPIMTNKSGLCVDGVNEKGELFPECVEMGPGELWWFNHRLGHSAFNRSDTSRVHLILDAVSEKYPVRN